MLSLIHTDFINERATELEKYWFSLQFDTQVDRWIGVQRLNIDVNLQNLSTLLVYRGFDLHHFFLLLCMRNLRGFGNVRCQNVKFSALQRVIIANIECFNFESQL